MVIRTASRPETDTCEQDVDAEDLIARFIPSEEGQKPADEVRLDPYGVSVWAIVAHLGGIDGDVARAAREYDLPIEAVCAALAFYAQHREAIDARIALHYAFFRS